MFQTLGSSLRAALVANDHSDAALAKYDEALKYAPLWKQLQRARDAAAKRAD